MYVTYISSKVDTMCMLHTVFPRIVRARSINFTSQMLRGQFEGALYSRARFNPTDCISARIRISFTSACRSR